MKKNILKLSLLFCSVSLMTGCAIPQRHALSLKGRQEIKSNKTILNTTQKGIRLQDNAFNPNVISPINPSDSGYIVKKTPGIDDSSTSVVTYFIDSAIRKHEVNKAKTAIVPVRNALHNFDYVNQFKADLQKNLSALPWLKLTKISTQYNIKHDEKKIVDGSKENTTLFIGTTYALNSNFNRLEVAAYVKLDEKQKNKKTPKTLYKNNFFYIYRVVPSKNTTKENIATRNKNNAVFLKEKLCDASTMLSNLIATDMSNPNSLSGVANGKIVTVNSFNYNAKDKAIVIEKRNDYYILSLIKDGSIYVVNLLH
ncbi:MAG: hypothetical protein NTU49_03755 [Gammaproteobacteria bacterium]|nr:hypothetical protein [Gammaproteobacteria bacterium]